VWSCPHVHPAPRPSARTIWALLHVLEATIETLKAENEILKRQLAAAETRAAQAAITERLDALAADRLDQLAAERARPWWRQLVG
jgi:hypothetical protein